MADRVLVWVSAGVITAGMSAAMVAGAGLAIADDASDTGGTSTSQSTSDSTESEADSTVGGDPSDDTDDTTLDPETTDPDVDEEELAEDDAAEEEPAEEEPAEEEPADEDPAGGRVDDDIADTDGSGSDRTDRATSVPVAPRAADDTERDVTVKADRVTEAVVEDEDAVQASEPVAQRMTVVVHNPVADIGETPEVQAVAFAMAPTAAVNATATAPQIPGIIRVLGTIVFNLYGVAIQLFGGPPILPANSTVTVRTSSLVLNCGCDDGDTIEVPADWYIPKVEDGKPPPDRLIYLQHGFLAAGPWYSHTAAALAEQTNSIVVAPSITSNFLAADACWLGAAPMHEAIADLFVEGNPALAHSALAAGYSGPVPDRVVLMGHSLGGRAVSGAAGFMAGNGSIERLAGVVLLDGVGLDDADEMKEALLKVPGNIPIYQLAAPVYFWNNFGVGIEALVEARPDKFVGVTLVNGSHVDTMRGGNPLIQFSQQLVSGFSTPPNVAAAQMLMVGWVDDMFAKKQQTGIYLEPGEEFSFDTPAGEAAVVALPNSLTKQFFLNPLKPLVPLGNFLFTLEPTCVATSMGAASSCQESIAA